MTENQVDKSSCRSDIDSPFHAGERAVQERVGVREKVEPYGRRGIRDHMPQQHREFFEKLPFLIVAAADIEQRLWAGMLAGEPGFMQSPGPTQLRVQAAPAFGDPLNRTWHDGSPIGCLGIELHTRRRNRLNGVMALDDDGGAFTLAVDQSFGNCPKYIQAREPRFLQPPSAQGRPRKVRHFTAWDDQVANILRHADTFFVASQYGRAAGDAREGVDVSHRGGPPGFVALRDAKTLVWPDYRGNFFFNTLGNLALNPRCGLLVIDFASADTVQLTGAAHVVWDWDRDDPVPAGAQRMVQFELEAGVHIECGSPFTWE
ncbi:MAG TPA: pyridoxamine 5'-phosphate oxidase family protein, partial [Ramlibacter sp.]|nr:pyridoxamine 5'-phosphate oxidase family protein [Ramlibacter sp.]